MYLRDCKVAYDDYRDELDCILMEKYRNALMRYEDGFIDEDDFKEVVDMEMPEK